ncbi:MAG: vitamin B12 dependent-methionine synthase activation domain-containing protein [Parvularculaceae bacterium]
MVANSDGDDIVLYTDETREELARFHGLRQQIAKRETGAPNCASLTSLRRKRQASPITSALSQLPRA